MKQSQKPKWQEEVEAIVREQFQGDELLEQLEEVHKLVTLANAVGIPSGDAGKVVALMLKWASEELRPLVLAYTGFRLGVAYERYQNANRARKP